MGLVCSFRIIILATIGVPGTEVRVRSGIPFNLVNKLIEAPVAKISSTHKNCVSHYYCSIHLRRFLNSDVCIKIIP